MSENLHPGFAILLAFLIGSAIILLFLIIKYWRNIYNKVVKFFHKLFTVFRKNEYLPPKITIEGYGVKRNLSLVEAALISESPFHIIFGILLHNTLEKEALIIKSFEPLRFKADNLLPDNLDKIERDFIKICCENNEEKRFTRLETWTVRMIRTVANKMRGFSHLETMKFYQVAVNEAAKDVYQGDIQNIVNRLIEDPPEFTRTITQQTNPYKEAPVLKKVPYYMRRRGDESSQGGGGGGCDCACACACAGCACAGCACACAGGGR